MAHIIMWRFRAKPDRVEQFRRIYGSDGAWAALFSRSAEYQGTTLLQDVTDPLLFIVIDRWAKGDSFERFHCEFGEDYEALDRKCLDLTDEETLVGNFLQLK